MKKNPKNLAGWLSKFMLEHKANCLSPPWLENQITLCPKIDELKILERLDYIFM